jgi:hypothetical protein
MNLRIILIKQKIQIIILNFKFYIYFLYFILLFLINYLVIILKNLN